MSLFKLHAKFLILVLGILIVFFGILSYVIIQREVRILSQKGAEKEHLLTRTIVADLKDGMLSGRPLEKIKKYVISWRADRRQRKEKS